MHLVRRVRIFPTRILLATDGSSEASLAEDAAVELSNGTGSELHVVHVLRTTPELPYPRSLAKKRSEALQRLSVWLTHTHDSYIRFR